MLTERWQRNLLALSVAQALTMLAFSFVFPFIPLYVQTLGVHGATEAAQWAGAIGAAAAVSMSIAQPIWGNLADRWGRKPMVLRSVAGGCITTALMGMASSPEQLMLIRLAQGAVTGTVAAANALVATSTPKNRLGFALGVLQLSLFLGASLGPLLGGVIADRLGFRIAFFAASALMIVGIAIVFLLVQEDFTKPATDAPRRGIWSESRSLLAIAPFPLLVGVVFMIQFGAMIVTPVLSLFIHDLSGGENAATAAGTVMAGTGVVSAISALVVGRLSDRVGHSVILPVCLLGAALAYLPQAFVQQVWQLFALRMLLGVFLGGLMPSANAMAAQLVPRQRRGALFGLMATATSLAGGVGPLSGAAIATFWDMRAVFLATGVLFGLAYGGVSLGLRRHDIAVQKAKKEAAEGALPPDEAVPPPSATMVPSETAETPLDAAGPPSDEAGSAPTKPPGVGTRR